MRIQHNIMAMNAYRNYNTNTSALSKNLEKLSSGYKINRAGDDAAGLAISEKMRAQITGLDKAQDNAKDGISLVQTAEGALTEVHDMLNRMYSLAEQSANGTYENETDRVQLQKEVVQLKSEINRIADSANFNGINLLDGSMADPTAAAVDYTINAGTALTAGGIAATGTAIGTNTIVYEEGQNAQKTKFEVDLSQLKWSAATANNTLTITIGNYSVTVTATTGGEQDIAALLSAAITTPNTQANVIAGTDAKNQFTVSLDGSKLTFELTGEADDVASTAALNANYKVSVTNNGGSTNGSNWNAGTTVLQQGLQTKAETLANTVISQTQLGMSTTAADNDGYTITVDGKSYVLAVGDDSDWAKYTGSGATVVQVNKDATVNEQLQALANAINKDSTTWNAGVDNNGNLTLSQKAGADGSKLTTAEDIAKTISTGMSTTAEIPAGDSSPLVLQIGDTSDSFNQLEVSIKDCHTTAIGIDKIDIGTQTGAAAALNVIKDAINYVSDVRGTLGATQNRLDHTINNLSVMQENIQDAESTIRDTDIADEMMSYTKNNILIQSAQAMLAQANQVPQGVLQLLQ